MSSGAWESSWNLNQDQGKKAREEIPGSKILKMINFYRWSLSIVVCLLLLLAGLGACAKMQIPDYPGEDASIEQMEDFLLKLGKELEAVGMSPYRKRRR